MKLAAVKIDVSKINKERLYEGKKGVYMDLMVQIDDEEDKYGNNVKAWEGQSKEEREAKKDRNFLGNGKVVFESAKKEEESDDKDDLPF